MDPVKLEALVDAQNQNPFNGLTDRFGEVTADEKTAASRAPDGKAALVKMGEFAQTLRDATDVIEGIAEELGEEILSADELHQVIEHDGEHTVSTEVAQEIKDTLDRMPGELRSGLATHLKSKSMEETAAIAQVLTDEALVTNTDLFGRWLYFAGQAA